MSQTQPRISFPGLTFRSVGVGLLGMLIATILMQHAGMLDAWNMFFGDEPLSAAVFITFLCIAIPAAGVMGLARLRFLSRAEMLCVLYAMMIAAPLTSHGFWRYMCGVTCTIPRYAEWKRYDAFNSKLWPHGPNLLENHLENITRSDVAFEGNLAWQTVETEEEKQARVAVLANTEAGENSWFRITIPCGPDGVVVGEPYLIAVLARAHDLGAETHYSCRVFPDDNVDVSEEIFVSRELGTVTFLQKKGFTRIGRYGIVIPPDTRRKVTLEFKLSGEGTVEFHDIHFMNVSSLEHAFVGRRMVSESEYAALPQDKRIGLVVKPDKMWSLSGVRFLLTGYVNTRDWLKPVVAWGGFIVLMLVLMFAIAVIMRKQWIENERYPMPLAHIPVALIGEETERETIFPALWKNRIMWIGFAIAFFWCLMKGWSAFNPNVPNMDIRINMSSYFQGGGWGKTWTAAIGGRSIDFSVYSMFLSIGLLLELNILLSLVAGFLLFRLQYWFGEAYGLVADTNFPYHYEQLSAAYVAYAVLVLFFTRKYLWGVLKTIIKGSRENDEVLSYRNAFFLIVAAILGIVGWSRWLELSLSGMLVFTLLICSIGFISMKLRAECGTPSRGFTSANAGLCSILPLIGGISLFGAEGFIVASFIVIFIEGSFFLLPGIQIELIELSRRYRVKKNHVILSVLFGIVGGIGIGGWVYLSSLSGVGLVFTQQGHGYDSRSGVFSYFDTDLVKVNDAYLVKAGLKAVEDDGQSMPIAPATWAAIFAAGVTALLTILRQLFAGFWFHPIGFIVGASPMAENIWGSMLVAWFIRFMVLKLGGAVTVRTKLLPCAIGLFLGTIAAYGVFVVVNGYIYFFKYGAGRFAWFF